MLIGLGILASPLRAGVVAYWRFEGDGGSLPIPGTAIAHSNGRTTAPPTGGVRAIDVSGNGNLLYGWDGGDGALTYSAVVPSSWTGATTNERSAGISGSTPRAFTWGTQAAPSGIDLDTWRPREWTIEATVLLDPAAATGWRSFLGRDGSQVATGNADLGCLYFQKTSGGYLRLEFVDVAGNTWEVVDPERFETGRWVHVAATSDGDTLRLYKWDTVQDPGYALVAETDISGSADPRLAADTISSTSLPLDTAGDPMNWTVGSAMYGSGGIPEAGHVDPWLGAIDEVRFSDQALGPGQFLFTVPLVISNPGQVDGAAGTSHFQFEWNSATGAYYRVSTTGQLAANTWVPVEAAVPATPPTNQWTSPTAMVDAAYYQVSSETPPVRLAIEPGQVLNPVDLNIYGHFLESIYHSQNGGLWGELVWNRSLEMWPAERLAWSIAGDALVQSTLEANVRFPFGEHTWTEYELTLQARKDGGNEGFLILFRTNGDDFYWANLGGWGNTRHALEKGSAGAGWGEVGTPVTGSITSGRWYDIRVRCDGNRFRVWLDGNEIINFTDMAGPHLSGQVGLGTWSTLARYRNIRVEDLGGAELYSGLPDLDLLGGNPVHWDRFGSATLDLSSQSLNTDYAVEVTKTAPTDGGLSQAPFRFDPQVYTGSFWAKGTGITGMVARLKDGDTVLAQAAFGAPTASWQAYPFQLTPSAPTLNGTLELGFLGSGTATVDQVSLMGQDAIDTGGYRPDLLQAAAELSPPVIRWPGGCFASAYRWKYGIGPQSQRRAHPIVQWEDQDVNAYGTDEFIRMCHRIGAEPILVINVGIGGVCGAGAIEDPYPSEAELLQDALDWIEYCNGPATSGWGAIRAANGHPEPYHVKYWEIDNETWSKGSSWYAARVNQYAPLMKQADPSIKLIAVGGGGFDQGWNRDIIDACAPVIDYISVHSYFNPDDYAVGPLDYENHLQALADSIAGSANPGLEIYNSEWNAQSIDLRTGLFAGGLLNVFERQGEVFTMGGPALMYRHLSATAWNNAFVNFDHTGSFRAPNYLVMRLWREHYAPWRIALNGESGPLNLVATRSDDGGQVFVKAVNPSRVPVRTLLELPAGTVVSGASMQEIADPSLAAANSLAEPERIGVEPRPATVIGSAVEVTFSGQSASVVVIQIQ